MKVDLVVVGKLKDVSYQKIENEYVKRLWPITIHELKSNAENKIKEAQDLEKKISELFSNNTLVILLDEKGNTYNSVEFAKWMQKQHLRGNQHFIFVIGGAEGFSLEIKNKYKNTLSLSAMTLPHRLTRILFIEQLYRAKTILDGHPYHNP
jgi:23S rRNA (pseudouridine1915-N3)-methyltransferase